MSDSTTGTGDFQGGGLMTGVYMCPDPDPLPSKTDTDGANYRDPRLFSPTEQLIARLNDTLGKLTEQIKMMQNIDQRVCKLEENVFADKQEPGTVVDVLLARKKPAVSLALKQGVQKLRDSLFKVTSEDETLVAITRALIDAYEFGCGIRLLKLDEES